MTDDLLHRVRDLALGLPEVSERKSHGAPCFFVRDRRPICYFHDRNDRDDRVTLWCPAPPGVAEELAQADPEPSSRPTPSSSGVFRHWLGLVLDPPPKQGVDWDEVASALEDAYRTVAPARLIKDLDGR